MRQLSSIGLSDFTRSIHANAIAAWLVTNGVTLDAERKVEMDGILGDGIDKGALQHLTNRYLDREYHVTGNDSTVRGHTGATQVRPVRRGRGRGEEPAARDADHLEARIARQREQQIGGRHILDDDGIRLKRLRIRFRFLRRRWRRNDDFLGFRRPFIDGNVADRVVDERLASAGRQERACDHDAKPAEERSTAICAWRTLS